MNSTYIEKLFITPVTKRRLNETYVRTPPVRKYLSHASIKNKIVAIRSATLKEKGLLGFMWKTYQINALYHFNYKRLTEYEKILGSYLKNALQKDFHNNKIAVKIQSFPEMAFTENDYPALKITITSEEEEVIIPQFTGFLLSIERKEGFLETHRIKAGAVILPLFLADSDEEIFLNICIKFLEENFSCLVKPLKFSPYDLMWMLAMWSFPGKNKCRSVSSTYLEYEVPFAELNSIVYVIDPYTVSEAWEGIMKPNSKELFENQVYAFISSLENHYYKICSIKLSHFQLRVIKTPSVRVEGNHSVIVLDSNQLFSIMRHLTHLAQEIVK